MSDNMKKATFGAGCFWCTEAVFQRVNGVEEVNPGYAGGHVSDPSYREVCSGQTGHAEVIQLKYDPNVIDYNQLLEVFFKTHDPTQLNRQGNDVGTQYRSAIYVPDEAALAEARASRNAYQAVLAEAGLGEVTTEIRQGVVFYYAEDWHQQYLHKNPGGYCGLRGTGVACPSA